MTENFDQTKRLKRDSREDVILTPPRAVKKLLETERFEGIGWEPASGTGNISRCFNPPLMSSDLSTEAWVYGEKGVDFLKANRQVDFIITNPPYSLTRPFVEHALRCARKVAMLVRIQFLESKGRYPFFKKNPPVRVYVFSGRVNCYRLSQSPTDVSTVQMLCWVVWEKGYSGPTQLRWIDYS